MRVLLPVVALLAFSGRALAAPAGDLIPVRLRCEARSNPLGVDNPRLRLTWGLAPARPGLRDLRMTAWQVRVAPTAAMLAAGRGLLWDSGRVRATREAQVAYAGRELRPAERCVWAVRAWDQRGRPSRWSEPATWEMGLLEEARWGARWISAPMAGSRLPVLRRAFSLSKPVRRARLYLCGLGHHEARINGRTVSDLVLDPGWTNYRRTCLYTVHDVTRLLRPGPNALGVLLGNGMYHVPGGRYVKFTGNFGPPKLIARLDAEHPDGSVTRVVSDRSWHAAPGPITFSCVYGGEDHDARLEPAGWDRPGFAEDAAWRPADECPGPGGRLRAQSQPPVVVQRVFEPVRWSEPRPGVLVADFGQNVSALPAIAVRGPAGATVKLTPAELLRDGLADQGQSGGPCTFSYTLRGGGVERWRPRFTYYGFRYLQIEGAARSPGEPGKPVLVGVQSHAVWPRAGSAGGFACSNPLWNRIHRLIRWAVVSNMKSIFTDCPHREKLGWLEQVHLLGLPILAAFDVETLFAKMVHDMQEAQLPNGLVPDIAPEYTVFSSGFRDSPEWGAAIALTPAILYRVAGDRATLAASWPAAARYVDYLASRANDGLVTHGLGDWADVGPNPPGSHHTPQGVTATAFAAASARAVASAALTLGKRAEARRYAAVAKRFERAFRRAFMDGPELRVATNSQAALGLAIVLGIARADERPALVRLLAGDVEARGWHTTAGDIGHRFALMGLAEGGRSDVVARMASQTDHPSYGYQLAHGATALTEAWDGPTRGWSQNHFMLGHLDEWYHHWLVGLAPAPGAVGYDRALVRPQPVAGAEWARGWRDTVRGRFAVAWRREPGGRFTLALTVPPNVTADVRVPAAGPVTEDAAGPRAPGVRLLRREQGAVWYRVGSGSYRFRSRLP